MKTPRVELTPERKEEIITLLKKFFSEKRDEEIGDLAARLILDFILQEIGPHFYNQGIHDAIAFMSDRVDDLYSLEI